MIVKLDKLIMFIKHICFGYDNCWTTLSLYFRLVPVLIPYYTRLSLGKQVRWWRVGRRGYEYKGELAFCIQ